MVYEYLSSNVPGFPYIVAVWTFMETFLLAGLTAGWASLVYVLKKEEIYEYLCEHQPTCGNNTALSLNIGNQFDSWNHSSLFNVLPSDPSLLIDKNLGNTSSASSDISFSEHLRNHSSFTIDAMRNISKFANESLSTGSQDTVSGHAIKLVAVNGTSTNSSSISSVTSENLLGLSLDSGRPESVRCMEDAVCTLQDDKFQLCVTVSLLVSAPLCLVLSRLNYRYGMRTTRLVSITLLLIGSASFGLISTDFPWLIFPGYLGLLIGGIGILQTNMQVSYMFDQYGSTVIGALSGGFDASGTVLLVAKIAYENGIPLRTTFCVIFVSNVILVISTFILLPKDFIQAKQQQHFTQESEINDFNPTIDVSEKTSLVRKSNNTILTKECEVCAENATIQESNMAASNHDAKGDNSMLRSYMCDPLYLLQGFWGSVNMLVISMFLGSLNSWLEKVVDNDDEKVSYYTNINYYAMLSAPVCSLLLGVMADSLYVLQPGRKKEEVRLLHSLIVPSVFTSATGFLLCVGVMLEQEEVTYFVAVMSVIYRSAIYSFWSSNLRLLRDTTTLMNTYIAGLEEFTRPQNDIDMASVQLTDLIHEEMDKTLKSRTKIVSSVRCHKKRRTRKPWWNEELQTLLNDMCTAEMVSNRIFRRSVWLNDVCLWTGEFPNLSIISLVSEYRIGLSTGVWCPRSLSIVHVVSSSVPASSGAYNTEIRK